MCKDRTRPPSLPYFKRKQDRAQPLNTPGSQPEVSFDMQNPRSQHRTRRYAQRTSRSTKPAVVQETSCDSSAQLQLQVPLSHPWTCESAHDVAIHARSGRSASVRRSQTQTPPFTGECRRRSSCTDA
jgi:2-succinyl-5-enolpyruvyl-6-hydroxy-3-cyclohexene-1-carboxylate synthase